MNHDGSGPYSDARGEGFCADSGGSRLSRGTRFSPGGRLELMAVRTEYEAKMPGADGEPSGTITRPQVPRARRGG